MGIWCMASVRRQSSKTFRFLSGKPYCLLSHSLSWSGLLSSSMRYGTRSTLLRPHPPQGPRPGRSPVVVITMGRLSVHLCQIAIKKAPRISGLFLHRHPPSDAPTTVLLLDSDGFRRGDTDLVSLTRSSCSEINVRASW
jgi:hypothetical protein